MQIILEDPLARAPERKSSGAAGYDLYSSEDLTVPAGSRMLASTGISIALPTGTYGQIAPRSGLAVRGIDIGAGVIDEDYRGIVKVLMINHSSEPLEIHHGDRIAQLVIHVIATPEVMVVDSLDVTERGMGGFGSTGK